MVKYTRTIQIVFFFFIVSLQLSCQTHREPGITHMTSELWEEDLNYLNKKIQKEFKSFNPDIKKKFKILTDELKEALVNLNNDEIAVKIGQLMAKLEDGHTEAELVHPALNFERLPLIFYFFEGNLYITGTQKEYKDLIGKQIILIGNKTIPEVFRLLKTIMTHDNDSEILHAGPRFLILPRALKFLGLTENTKSVQFTIKDSSKTYVKKVTALSIDKYNTGPWLRYWDINNIKRPLYGQKNEYQNWFKFLKDENIMYFHYGANNDLKGQPSVKKTTNQLFNAINTTKPKKLIIDMRNNSGGNYYKSRPLINKIKKHPFINEKGRLYVISGRRTFSAAMVTSIFFKQETEAILVGEISRGHPNKTDNVEHMLLPNSKWRLEYTTRVKKHWPELKDSDHVPIDVEIVPNFKDYSKGIDPVLRYILNN